MQFCQCNFKNEIITFIENFYTKKKKKIYPILSSFMTKRKKHKYLVDLVLDK